MQRARVQFTVRRFMALVSFLALGLAVVRHAVTHWGASEVFTVGPIVLFLTNLLAAFQRAVWQGFWVGLGICGWV